MSITLRAKGRGVCTVLVTWVRVEVGGGRTYTGRREERERKPPQKDGAEGKKARAGSHRVCETVYTCGHMYDEI